LDALQDRAQVAVADRELVSAGALELRRQVFHHRTHGDGAQHLDLGGLRRDSDGKHGHEGDVPRNAKWPDRHWMLL
jgi:hypothetical protein